MPYGDSVLLLRICISFFSNILVLEILFKVLSHLFIFISLIKKINNSRSPCFQISFVNFMSSNIYWYLFYIKIILFLFSRNCLLIFIIWIMTLNWFKSFGCYIMHSGLRVSHGVTCQRLAQFKGLYDKGMCTWMDMRQGTYDHNAHVPHSPLKCANLWQPLTRLICMCNPCHQPIHLPSHATMPFWYFF